MHLLTGWLCWGAMVAEDAPVKPGKTILDYVQSGGIVGYIIVLLSFVALALVIVNLLTLRRARLAPPEVVRDLHGLMRERDYTKAIAYCQLEENDSFLTRVLGNALVRCSRSPLGFLEIRSALEESGQKEMDGLGRATDGIGLIASVGPMLGLLGTVIGMIGAFATIGELEGAARSRELASYMALALVNTAEGLFVAIPCTVAYALFRKRTERLAGEVSQLIEDWVSSMEPEAATGPAAKGTGPAGARGNGIVAGEPARGARPA